MREITEKQWENICKDCSHPNLHVALLEYANLDEYLRKIVVLNENLKPSDNSSSKKDCHNTKCPINIRNNKSKIECPNKCLDRKNQPMYNCGHSDY